MAIAPLSAARWLNGMSFSIVWPNSGLTKRHFGSAALIIARA